MKVKSTLVGNEQPTPQIDWNKPQLVSFSNPDGELYWVIQTNAKSTLARFEGMVVYAHPNASITIGDFRRTWVKKSYNLLPLKQSIVLFNSND